MADEIERANAYNTAVLGVGYGGIFAIFTLTHEMLGPKSKAIVAILLLVSIILYVGWVVASMIRRVLIARRRGDTYGKWMDWLWVPVLCATTVTALVAAGIMGWHYLLKIIA